MAEIESPLGPAWRPGVHGNTADGAGVALSETAPGSIVQAAAWRGEQRALLAAVAAATGLDLPDRPGGGALGETVSAFSIGPGRLLVVDQAEGLAARLSGELSAATGTVTDLSHGRTALRIAGPRAEWVLAKLFAIDFSAPAFAVGAGISTAHHDVFAQIQRTGAAQFDLYVFRSFARAFWRTLTHAAEEVGYEVS